MCKYLNVATGVAVNVLTFAIAVSVGKMYLEKMKYRIYSNSMLSRIKLRMLYFGVVDLILCAFVQSGQT